MTQRNLCVSILISIAMIGTVVSVPIFGSLMKGMADSSGSATAEIQSQSNDAREAIRIVAQNIADLTAGVNNNNADQMNSAPFAEPTSNIQIIQKPTAPQNADNAENVAQAVAEAANNAQQNIESNVPVMEQIKETTNADKQSETPKTTEAVQEASKAVEEAPGSAAASARNDVSSIYHHAEYVPQYYAYYNERAPKAFAADAINMESEFEDSYINRAIRATADVPFINTIVLNEEAVEHTMVNGAPYDPAKCRCINPENPAEQQLLGV